MVFPGLFAKQEAAVVAVFFLVLFLLWMAVDMWITGVTPVADSLLAWPCEKIGQEAEKRPSLGHEARPEGSSRLLSNVVHQKTEHYLGLARMSKGGQVATKN